jgi:putative addiction module component (TIGR02574 family)
MYWRGGFEGNETRLAQIRTACIHEPMTPAVAQILEEAEQLSAPERAELADRIVESLAHDIPPDIAEAQLAEVRRRIVQVETGEVVLIPGAEALAHVRRLVASARVAN